MRFWVVKTIRTDAGQKRMVRVKYDALGNKRFSWDEAGEKTEFQYEDLGFRSFIWNGSTKKLIRFFWDINLEVYQT